MQLHQINMNQWARKDLFTFYIQQMRCVISLTADVNVGKLVSVLKKQGLRFYPTFIYLVSKAVNRREELRMAYDAIHAPALWESVSPSYIVFHPEDQAFTRLVTAYDPSFTRFYAQAVADMEKYALYRAFEVAEIPANTFDVSCLPWCHYKSLDLHVFDEGTYLAPVITWGKYQKMNGHTLMPLTLQIHHAVADGFHVARFFQDVEEEMLVLIAQLSN